MRRLLLLLTLLFATSAAQLPGADKVSAKLSQSQLSISETAILTVSVQGLAGDIRLSEPSSRGGGLQFNHIGQRFSMTSINGVSNTATEYEYEVVPLKKGRHIIDPISVTVSGMNLSTESLRLEVVDSRGSSGPSYTPHNPYSPYTRRHSRRSLFEPQRSRPDDVLLEAELLPEKVYKHQPTLYSLRLLTAVNLYGDPRYSPVSPTGLLMVPFAQENKTERRHGRDYQVSEVNAAFFPLTEGTYEFPATEVKVRTGPFSSPKPLIAGKQKLTVVPLPSEGRPRSFTGAVGEDFQIQALLKQTEVVEGQTVELSVSVSGDGHLELVPYPYLPEWDGIEHKQTTSPSTTTVENGKLVSKRTYNFRLKPTRAGSYDMSEIALAFFRPSLERYEVIKAAPMTLNVRPGGEALRKDGSDLSKELPEPDQPALDPGPSGLQPPHLSQQFFLVVAGLLALGLALNFSSARFTLSRSGLFQGARFKHDSLPALLEHIHQLAPGSDTLSRQRELLSRGWSDPQIAQLENLRTAANRALYGGAKETQTLSQLSQQLKTLLKEVRGK